LLGYEDHQIDREGSQVPLTRLVRRQRLDAPEEALRTLRTWTASPRRHEFASALEEALALLEGIGWRPGSRRVLLTVGSGPPHPHKEQRARAFPCPNQPNWQALLEDERRRGDLRCLAVTERERWFDEPRLEPTLRQRIADAWAELGRTQRVERADVDPE